MPSYCEEEEKSISQYFKIVYLYIKKEVYVKKRRSAQTIVMKTVVVVFK